MTVVLEPPLTRSGTWSPPDMPLPVPLLTGPRFVRGPRSSRWHRPRSGTVCAERVTYLLWCGQRSHRSEEGFATAEELPRGAALCGTCDGRAVGAGQDTWSIEGGPELLFTPNRLIPPARCPGSRTEWCTLLAWNVGTCLICGVTTPLRSSGGPYNSRWGMTNHPPGPALVPGCPFHAWRELELKDGHVRCGCGRPGTTQNDPEQPCTPTDVSGSSRTGADGG